jgi:hypothetical protein
MGGGGGGGGGNRNGRPISPRHQTFDSNGPDVRVRGNAYQVFEKYQALARDAALSGDRIAAENYYQHAEHYYRIIAAYGDGQPYQPQAMRDQHMDGEGGEGSDGGEATAVPITQPAMQPPMDPDAQQPVIE